MGMPNIEVATPPEFPGGHPGIWSPEHLFVGAAEICLMTTFLSLAEKAKLRFANYTSEAEGFLEKTEGELRFTRIVLYPKVVVEREEDVEKAHKLLEKAEKYCLNSMRTEVSIQPTVTAKRNK
jgi:organic hydroperoxide reductase OsmC/OhrA